MKHSTVGLPLSNYVHWLYAPLLRNWSASAVLVPSLVTWPPLWPPNLCTAQVQEKPQCRHETIALWGCPSVVRFIYITVCFIYHSVHSVVLTESIHLMTSQTTSYPNLCTAHVQEKPQWTWNYSTMGLLLLSCGSYMLYIPLLHSWSASSVLTESSHLMTSLTASYLNVCTARVAFFQ